MVELPPPEGREDLTLVTRLGVAAVDVAAGHVLVGEFLDDEASRAVAGGVRALQAFAPTAPLLLSPSAASFPSLSP